MQGTLFLQRGGLASCSPRVLVPPRPSQRAGHRPRVAARSSVAGASVPALVVEQIEEEILLPLPPLESAVDEPGLHNPLVRFQRQGTGWFGVIMEYEGVLVEDTHEAHTKAWLAVAEEFGFPRPLGHLFRRIKGVRDEVVVSRVFNWTQNPTTARQIAKRKMAVYEELLNGRQPAEMLEARPFLEMLRKYDIPIALACALPEARLKEGLKRINMMQYFDAIITAEDSGAPEVEFYYSYASQSIKRPPMRCVVVGESNTAVEGAHELGMKCVVITGNKPVYDFTAADLVVRNLSQLTFFNMKRLFGNENLVASKLLEQEQDEYGQGEVDDPELDDFPPLPPNSMYFSGR